MTEKYWHNLVILAQMDSISDACLVDKDCGSKIRHIYAIDSIVLDMGNALFIGRNLKNRRK